MADHLTNAPAPADDPDEEASVAGIELRGLYKVFGPNPAGVMDLVREGISKTELNDKHSHILGLKDINLTMPAGRIQVVMGLSGSGKSTLIRHINRLIEPTAGEVLFEGQDVCSMSPQQLRDFRRHKTAMVFQKFALLPHRTVLRNTIYGLEIQGIPEREAKERAARWLTRVGLEGYEDYYPNQLSGGMQQRVGLARALANDAGILLMDEAYSALDPLIRMDMQKVLLDLQQELKKTIVFITHDLDEALRLGDRIAILRDGEIVQDGTGQEIVLRPADSYIADFVREVNRGRVLKVNTIMRKGELAETELTIPSGSLLEDAARLFSQTSETAAIVTRADGRKLGTIQLHDMIAAMVSPG